MPSSNATRQCHHIKTSGVRCGSPALRSRRYCYYHQRHRPVMLNVGWDSDPRYFSLPLLEDAHDIQSALRQVALYYLNGMFNEKKAGLMFYALQIATSNLKLMQAEKPQPDQVVADVPQLSEIPRPEPVSEPVPLNSHTNRETHFPETPSPLDEYQDDVMRQAREVHEQIVTPTLRPGQPDGDKYEVLKRGRAEAAFRYMERMERMQ